MYARPKLSTAQIDEFHERGLIKLGGFYPAQVMAPMRAAIWAFLQKRDGIKEAAPSTWPSGPLSKLAKLNAAAAFDPLDTEKMQQGLSPLVSGHPVQPFPGGGHRQALITFPDAEKWCLPHAMWHTDLPHAPGRSTPQGLQTFICLDEVAPQGGGTLVLTGSHRVHVGAQGQIASGQFKKLFEKQSAYAAALFDKNTPNRNTLLKEAGSYEGIALQPIELTGQAGDVYIMDMRCLHTLSPNVLDKPRRVVTQRFTVV